MCCWGQVHSFHLGWCAFDLSDFSFTVNVVKQCFSMIYLQPHCSILPLWWCLSYLFHPLQEFLRLYHTVLPLHYLQTPILTCTLALANLKANISVFTHNLLDNISSHAFVHYSYYSCFSPLTSGIIHCIIATSYFTLSFPPHFSWHLEQTLHSLPSSSPVCLAFHVTIMFLLCFFCL